MPACEVNGQGSSPAYAILLFVILHFQFNHVFSFFHGSVRVSRLGFSIRLVLQFTVSLQVYLLV